MRELHFVMHTPSAKIAYVMETIILIAIVLSWLAIAESSISSLPRKLKLYRPTMDVKIGLNAMKNFGRFVVVFAVLYWIQIQFGDAEAWFDGFQRN